MSWRFGLMLGLLTISAALVGCDRQEPAPPAAGDAAAAPQAPIKLAAIVFQEDQFFQLVLLGMREAAREAGVQLLEANSNGKPEKEIELITTYVTRQVDGIVISPLSKTASATALKLAHDKGITVVTYNTTVEAQVPAAFVECSSEDLGAKTGAAARQYIEEKLGGKAKVAIVAFKSLAPEQSEARTNGFKNEIAKLPGVEIVAEQDAWLPEMAVKKVGDMLIANPEINVVWSANEGGTIGAVLAVKSAGKAGKIVVFGTDSSEQLLGFLQSPDDILQAITSQQPVKVGATAIELAIKAIRHEPVEKKVSLPGLLLSRNDMEGVKAFETQFKAWVGGRP